MALFPPKYGRRNMENGEEEEDDCDRLTKQTRVRNPLRARASMHAKFIRRAMQCFNDEREKEEEEETLERQKISLPLPIPARPLLCSAHV